MIISDKHRFVFIHIPKCAGTSVRASLQRFDDKGNEFTSRVANHNRLGELDYVHIPLFVLRDHFRLEFEAVLQYWSFAILRDPYARFASSVSQRLRKSRIPIHKLAFSDLNPYIEGIISFLSHQRQDVILLPPDYIHFQRQVDYVGMEGKRIVSSLYTVDEITQLLSDVSCQVGQQLSDIAPEGTKITANQTKVFRNDLLRRVIEASRPATNKLSKVLPENLKHVIRDSVYVERDKRLRGIFEADNVRSFIRNYYAEDIELYNDLLEDKKSLRT